MSDSELDQYRERMEKRLVGLVRLTWGFLVGAFVVGGLWAVALYRLAQSEGVNIRQDATLTDHSERLHAHTTKLAVIEASRFSIK